MNTLYLKYAIEVAKTGSISQAADNLYMGQPNLSKAIKELEASIGITIFNRTSKGVELTSRGKEFLRHARNVLSQIDEIEALYNPNENDKLTFSLSSAKTSYINDAFAKFINLFDVQKDFDISIKETNSIETIENVYMNEYKLGLIRYQASYEKYLINLLAEKDLEMERFWNFEFLVLLSKDHPLAFYDEISYHDLASYIEIVYCDLASPSLSLPDLKKLPVPENKKRVYVYEGNSQFNILTQVPKTYMWDSPLTPELLDRYGLVQRRCKFENNNYIDAIIYPKKYCFTELDNIFMNVLNQYKTIFWN